MLLNLFLLSVCILLSLIPHTVFCKIGDLQTIVAFQKWRLANKRVYLNEDEQVYRQLIFFDNYERINQVNNNKQLTYEAGLNEFSDMSSYEFSQRILNNGYSDNNTDNNEETVQQPSRGASINLPSSVDWRTKGVVGPIKDQGRCSSCWAFAASGILESFIAMKNGTLTSLSEQQLVDCATRASGYKSLGCFGGMTYGAIQYAIDNGIVTSNEYPYTGKEGKCKFQNKTQGFYPKSYVKLPQTVEALRTALSISPVQVGVNATTWQDYKGGVFNGCGIVKQFQNNHDVVAVGYDEQGNWIIKNSFGTKWGENGYIRIQAGNTCGIIYNNVQVTG